ncbi:hypothetical protein ACQ4M3_19110 [Leptolyngbya sp. AN03gr2]|uniref:hypothetical protein n=1 Tax=Leptolyngbya sp. AN03gr2 TaxID=3423364 RepID=UPI003D31ECA4
MQTSTNTILGACQQAIRYLNDQSLLLGVGNTSRWMVEGSPPSADASALFLPELVGYFPMRRQSVIYPHPNGNFELSSGERYFEVDSDDPYELAQVGGFRVLIEGVILHEQLRSINAYRSVGVFTGCRIADGLDSYDLIETRRVTGAVLDHLIHLERPFVRAPGVEHVIQVVKTFYRS